MSFFRLLYQSLGVLNEHFTTHSQEDAVEFLTQFFSALREEFNRLMHNNKVHAAGPDKCQSKHDSNDAMNNCQEDESDTYIQLKNPVNENIIFKLKESHSCMT
jgi:ubiquitin C-terminal hydrolase